MSGSQPPSPNLAPSPRVSFGSPLTRPSTIANDGYNYSYPGSAPEDEKTGDPVRKSPTTLSQEVEILGTVFKPNQYDGPSLKIFSRPIDGAWRPRVPVPLVDDPPDPDLALPKPPDANVFEILHNWTKKEENGETKLSLTVLESGPNQPWHDASSHIKWVLV